MSSDSGELVAEIPQRDTPNVFREVTAIAFNNDASVVAIAGTQLKGTPSVQLFATPTGRAVGAVFLDQFEMISGIRFSPDGHLFAIACGRELSLWDTQTLERVGPAFAVPYPFPSVSPAYSMNMALFDFCPQGTKLAAACSDTGVLWDVRSGKQLSNSISHGGSYIRALAFSPDATVLATGGADSLVRFWSATDGEPFGLPLQHDRPVSALAFSPRGSKLASRAHDLWLWDFPIAETKQLAIPIFVPGEHLAVDLNKHGGNLYAWKPDNLTRYDVTTGASSKVSLDPVPIQSFLDPVSISPDLNNLVKADVELKHIEPSELQQVERAFIDRSGKWIREEPVFRFYDVHSGKSVGIVPRGSVNFAPSFRQDGSMFATIDSEASFLWDRRTMERFGPSLGKNVEAVEFCPGHSILAIGDRAGVRLWNVLSEVLSKVVFYER
jgi:WD40 repeat protein